MLKKMICWLFKHRPTYRWDGYSISNDRAFQCSAWKVYFCSRCEKLLDKPE